MVLYVSTMKLTAWVLHIMRVSIVGVTVGTSVVYGAFVCFLVCVKEVNLNARNRVESSVYLWNCCAVVI